MDFIRELQKELVEVREFPAFGAGDTVTVSYKIKEGNKERIQQFQGDGQLITRCYWKLDSENRLELSSDNAYAERFYSLFEDAVRSHLRSDVAIGTCLSGGLDSSSIVCIANRLLMEEHTLPAALVGMHQKTFSSCFDDPRFDERPFIEQVLAVTGAESNLVFPNASQMIDVLPKIIWHQDEPFGSTSIFAQWSVMQRVAERGVKVLLDGQGADEMLAGYHNYFHYFWGSLAQQGRWHELKREINTYRQYYPLPVWRAMLQMGQNFVPQPVVRWARQMKRDGANVGSLGLNPEFAREHSRRFYRMSHWHGDMFDDFLYDNLLHYSLPGLLRYEDRNSMAHSIEARVPFLDYRLVEFAAALPREQKIKNATTKVILRNAMRKMLPDGVRQRRDKMGFVTPEKVWLKAELGGLLREVTHSTSFIQRGYLDAAQIQGFITDHENDKRDITFIASRWLTMELWFRQFIDGGVHAFNN